MLTIHNPFSKEALIPSHSILVTSVTFKTSPHLEQSEAFVYGKHFQGSKVLSYVNYQLPPSSSSSSCNAAPYKHQRHKT